MKIWLKSPDPNHQCCDCSSKNGPCDSCNPCDFSSTGVNWNTTYPGVAPTTFKNLYNKECSVYIEDGACDGGSCSAISSFIFTTGLDYTKFSTPISRNFFLTTPGYFGVPFLTIDGGQKILVHSVAVDPNSPLPISQGWGLNYSIQSNSGQGLILNSATPLPGGQNGLNFITYFNSLYHSGDTLIFSNLYSYELPTYVFLSDSFSLTSTTPIDSNNVIINENSTFFAYQTGKFFPTDSNDNIYGPFYYIYYASKQYDPNQTYSFTKLTFDSGLCISYVYFPLDFSSRISFNPPPNSVKITQNIQITNAKGSLINPLSQFSNIEATGYPFYLICPNLP